MKYALIGCGRIATNHVKAVLNNGLEFIAVCDVKPEQMENLLEKHDLKQETSIKRYTDYKKMIEDNEPQLAEIQTELILEMEKGSKETWAYLGLARLQTARIVQM